jgi:hypothetical protein
MIRESLLNVAKLCFSAFILLASLFALSGVRITAGQTVGAMRDFYVAAEYDFGGIRYDVFSPQMLVVEQSDQVNITVRNLGNQEPTAEAKT